MINIGLYQYFILQMIEQHVFHESVSQSFKDLAQTLEKCKDVNSTCEQSINDNTHELLADDEGYIDSSPMRASEIQTRRNSSYQAQNTSLTIQRNFSCDNVKQSFENFEGMEKLLRKENQNLKDQNRYIMNQVMKLRATNNRLKEINFQQNSQTAMISQELRMQIQRTQDLAKLMKELTILENKLRKVDCQAFPTHLRSISEISSDQ